MGHIFRVYMLPFQERVVSERAELDLKIKALIGFFDTEMFQELPRADQEILADQYDCMMDYSLVLKKRIDRFVIKGR